MAIVRRARRPWVVAGMARASLSSAGVHRSDEGEGRLAEVGGAVQNGSRRAMRACASEGRYLVEKDEDGSCRAGGGGTGFQPVWGRRFTGKMPVPLGGHHPFPHGSRG